LRTKVDALYGRCCQKNRVRKKISKKGQVDFFIFLWYNYYI